MITYFKALVGSKLASKKGQGMVEYGLILGLIAVAVVAILVTMGGQLNNIFTKISTELGTAAGNTTP